MTPLPGEENSVIIYGGTGVPGQNRALFLRSVRVEDVITALQFCMDEMDDIEGRVECSVGELLQFLRNE